MIVFKWLKSETLNYMNSVALVYINYFVWFLDQINKINVNNHLNTRYLYCKEFFTSKFNVKIWRKKLAEKIIFSKCFITFSTSDYGFILIWPSKKKFSHLQEVLLILYSLVSLSHNTFVSQYWSLIYLHKCVRPHKKDACFLSPDRP